MKNIIVSLFVVVVAVGLNYIAQGYSLVTLCLLAFAVQWLAFIPAAIYKTENFYDLTGSLTYITCICFALLNFSEFNPRAIVTTLLVSIWAARLGSFLFLRIKKSGKDMRFDEIKVSPSRFFVAWTLQGLWVSLTSLGAWIGLISSETQPTLGVVGFLGLGIWLFGFAFEVIADKQKSAFKADKSNEGDFINSGLWALCRHPNYFGEIVLWTGVFVMNIELYKGPTWLAAISPIFVYFLLTRISGIPMLTERAQKTWGNDPKWREYYENTPALIPKLF